MDCLSYLFNLDPPIQLQDCLIPNMDMIISETDSFYLQSQPQLQFQPPLFQEEVNELDTFCNQLLPSQEISYPKTKICNETYSFDSFLHTSTSQRLVNSSYNCNNNEYFPSHYHGFVREGSIFSEFRVPDFSLAFKVGNGNGEDTKKPTLSSQSVAARERRRRIAEKTQELGKLIPGGQKLNTAEMFLAATKYVKFLQSQIGILKLMQTTKQTEDSFNVEIETQVLLESQEIQEKLSTEEVCLVPREMVRELTSKESIWRNPKICREILSTYT